MFITQTWGKGMSALMRLFVACAAVLMAFVVGGAAFAQNDPVYVVTYVDVMPNVTKSGAAMLRNYRDTSRKESGNVRTDVLQEIARSNRFAIVEIWKDKAASDALIRRQPARSLSRS